MFNNSMDADAMNQCYHKYFKLTRTYINTGDGEVFSNETKLSNAIIDYDNFIHCCILQYETSSVKVGVNQ